MTFYAFGLNHESASVKIRECFALSESDIAQMYRAVSLSADAEWLLISTCNRTEAFVYGLPADVHSVQSALSARTRQSWPSEASFFLEGEAAVSHLLEVTVGLDSLVLGDAQIFAQVKDTYRLAHEEGVVGTVMHRLLHTAFRAAKQVINETALTSGAASVPSAAVALARSFFEARSADGLAGRRALLLGAGKMGRLAVEALRPQGLASVCVTNRSESRARDLARATGARLAPWPSRHQAVADADVVIVATGADAPVLFADELPVRSGADAPTLIIDIAVPRNVDANVDALPGYRVMDLDDLNAHLVRIEEQRRASAPAARAICSRLQEEFLHWYTHHNALQPAIEALSQTFEAVRRQEVERHAHRFSELEREELDRLTRSILQKLLAVPVVRLKDAAPESLNMVHGVRLLSALFARPNCEDPSARPSIALTAALNAAPSGGDGMDALLAALLTIEGRSMSDNT